MRRFTKKQYLVAGVAAALIAGTAGAALAYWTQGGTGSGTGATGTTNGITVNQTSTVSGMYPGSTPQALSGNFDNPNSGGVTISSVTAVVSSITGGTADNTKPDCTPADFAITGTAAGSTVPTGTGVGTWSGLSLQLLNTAANQDNCKNAVANITYTANS